MKLVLLIFVVFFIILFTSHCTRDQVEPVLTECGEIVVYEDQIKPIFDNACSYSGCHSGGAPGTFTNYAGIENYFNSGQLESRVLILRNMPPVYATEGPTNLSPEELELFQCWVQSGYPKN